jgi:hypothetical protein
VRRARVAQLAVLLIGVGAGGAAGYAVGSHRSNVTVLTGTFYAGDREATAHVDGWAYGISDSVRWLDTSNAWHDHGWPDCLAPVGTRHTVRFAWTPVEGPAVSWRQVVWVSCAQ